LSANQRKPFVGRWLTDIYIGGIDRKPLAIETSRIVADQIENISSPCLNAIEGTGKKEKKNQLFIGFVMRE